ncbi:11522_t:CDS:2, partial [Funneliformis caledonium]
ALSFTVVEGSSKNDQERGEVKEGSKNDQENGVEGEGLTVYPRDLPKELRDLYGRLSFEAKFYFTYLKSNEEKKAFLEMMLAERKIQRKTGVSLINFFANIVVLLIVIGLIVVSEKIEEKSEELYSIISYSTTYSVQSIAIVLVLFCEKGFNKEFFICTSYVSLPLCLSGIVMGVMTHHHIEPILAISLFGPGVLFADWIKDLL